MEGLYKGHLVHVPGQVGKQGGSPRSALAVLPEFKGGLHQWPYRIFKKPGGGVETLQFLTIAFRELGLVIPGIDMGRAAVDEEPDNMLCFPLEVRLSGLKWIFPEFDSPVTLLVQE